MAKSTAPADPFLKLPKRVRDVIERCRGGETLCRHFRTLRSREDGPSQDWFFEPSGKSCGPVSAERAAATPFLVSNADGLFPGDAQTFRAAP